MYLTLKYLHPLGVVLFAGNLAIGAVRHACAPRKGNAALMLPKPAF